MWRGHFSTFEAGIMAIDKANCAMAKAPGEIRGGEREAPVEVLETGGQVGVRLVQQSMRRIEAAQNKSPSLATCQKWIEIFKLARQAGGCPEGCVGAELEELLELAEDEGTCGMQTACLISEYCSMVAKDEQQECFEKIKGKIRDADAERGRELNRGSKRGPGTTYDYDSKPAKKQGCHMDPCVKFKHGEYSIHRSTGRGTCQRRPKVKSQRGSRKRGAKPPRKKGKGAKPKGRILLEHMPKEAKRKIPERAAKSRGKAAQKKRQTPARVEKPSVEFLGS